jgi:hypothetical protein
MLTSRLGVSYFNNETGEMGWGETNEFQENSYQSLEFGESLDARI